MLKQTFAAVAALSMATVGVASAANAQESVSVAVFTADPFAGYCVDIMNAIAARAGLEISEFQPTAVPDMIPAVAEGNADVLCSGLSPRADRREAGLAFTSAILTSQEAIVVLATNDTAYPTLADFAAAGAIIGGEEGSSFLAMAADAGVQVREFRDNDELAAALRAGEITGWIRSDVSFGYQQAVQGLWSDLKTANGYAPTRIGYGTIAVHVTNTALLGQIQAGLELIKADHTLDEIAGEWGMPLPPF